MLPEKSHALDLHMPHVGGYEVCKRVKGDPATSLLPIVILTGESEFDARMQAWEVGADDFLTKPFQSVEVAPSLCGNATEMQVILRQPRQVLQRTDIVQPELTLYERDQTFTAKRLQDTIHVHRRQSQCIGDIELGQR